MIGQKSVGGVLSFLFFCLLAPLTHPFPLLINGRTSPPMPHAMQSNGRGRGGVGWDGGVQGGQGGERG